MASLAWKRFRRHPGAMVGAFILIILILSISLPGYLPMILRYQISQTNINPHPWTHPFGTDGLGRDILIRVLYGGRVSLFVGFMVVGITLSIGVPIGAIAGYFGGWIDNMLMRIIDATFIALADVYDPAKCDPA